jgi:hypothetical protein
VVVWWKGELVEGVRREKERRVRREEGELAGDVRRGRGGGCQMSVWRGEMLRFGWIVLFIAVYCCLLLFIVGL